MRKAKARAIVQACLQRFPRRILVEPEAKDNSYFGVCGQKTGFEAEIKRIEAAMT